MKTAKWTKIEIPDDPTWVEWHRPVTSPRHGEGILKVYDGYLGIQATIATPNICGTMDLDATDIESAKVEALAKVLDDDPTKNEEEKG